jgi:ribosomal protein L37AE/L43A
MDQSPLVRDRKNKKPKIEIVRPPKRGDECPQCKQGKLDYNGMLDLECDHCRYTLSGGAGCT